MTDLARQKTMSQTTSTILAQKLLIILTPELCEGTLENVMGIGENVFKCLLDFNGTFLNKGYANSCFLPLSKTH